MPGPIRHRSRRPGKTAGAPDQTSVAPAEDPAIDEGDVAEGQSAARDPGEYAVGYGKPPRHSRFAAGVSGNPRGRPKGSWSLAEQVTRELDRPVTIRENGRERKMAKREVMAKQLAKNAMTGNLKAIAFIARMEAEGSALSKGSEPLLVNPAALTPERADEILADYLKLHGRAEGDAADDSPAGEDR